jgi:hypothetical protein
MLGVCERIVGIEARRYWGVPGAEVGAGSADLGLGWTLNLALKDSGSSRVSCWMMAAEAGATSIGVTATPVMMDDAMYSPARPELAVFRIWSMFAAKIQVSLPRLTNSSNFNKENYRKCWWLSKLEGVKRVSPSHSSCPSFFAEHATFEIAGALLIPDVDLSAGVKCPEKESAGEIAVPRRARATKIVRLCMAAGWVYVIRIFLRAPCRRFRRLLATPSPPNLDREVSQQLRLFSPTLRPFKFRAHKVDPAGAADHGPSESL